jgi:hypothetical protein
MGGKSVRLGEFVELLCIVGMAHPVVKAELNSAMTIQDTRKIRDAKKVIATL